MRSKTIFSYPTYCLWILGFYSLFLWKYCVPFTGDEKVYASIAMEMWDRNSWLYPLLFGEHSYFKPPFQYWVTMASWKVFGFGSFGAYFPSVIALTGTAGLIGAIQQILDKRPHSDRSPGIAGVWFAGCFGTLTYGTTLQMEIWIVFFYMAVWWASLKFLVSYQWRWLYLALGLAGASALVKSPLYSVFSVFGLWIFLFLQNKTDVLKKLHFYGAHLFGILIGISWYFLILVSDRDRFWDHYIARETLSKTGGNGSTGMHMWLDFSTFSMPFTFLLVFAILGSLVFCWNLAKKGRLFTIFQNEKSAFLMASLLLPAVFFSNFPYRTETYLYILLPSLMLWLDWSISRQTALRTPGLLLGIKINGIILFILISIASLILVGGGVVPAAIGILFVFSGALFCYFSWKLSGRIPAQAGWTAMAFSCLLIVTVARIGAISLGESDIHTLKEVAKAFPARKLNFYDEGRNIWHEAGILSIATGSVSHRSYSPPQAVSALKNQEILIVSDAQKDALLPVIQAQFSKTPELEIISWKRWKRGFNIPTANDLLQLGNRKSKEWETQNQREFKVLLLKS